ncbi:hypothetical protein EV424DRAFT_304151 [Suillus variegatus]|nr:hypothetical protein EV424DRAFT_304151 [Suillus variegatus]
MNMASLLKVPFILSSAITQHVSFTPPNVPLSEETIPKTFNERVFTRFIMYGFPIMKVSVVTACPRPFPYSDTLDSLLDCFCRRARYHCLSHIGLFVRYTEAIAQHAAGYGIRDTPINFPFILGTTLAVAGGLGRWWCYRTLGRFFTFQISVRKGHHIVTTGPYAIIRHPAYTAGIMQLIGLVMLHGSPTSWLRHSGVLDIPGFKLAVVSWLAGITLLVINIVFRVNEEDEALKSAFGDEWARWAKVVRYRLIPGVY